MSVDLWKSIFDTVAVVTALLAFIAGAGALWTGNILNQRQDKQLKQFESNLKDKDIKIAAALAEAAKANLLAEQERLARVQIEEIMGGWKFHKPGAADALIENLRPFAGTHFSLYVNPVESAFLDEIDLILCSAGWNRDPPKGPITFGNKALALYVNGFTIELNRSSLPNLRLALNGLTEGLANEEIPVKINLDATGRVSPNVLHIVIGKRE